MSVTTAKEVDFAFISGEWDIYAHMIVWLSNSVNTGKLVVSTSTVKSHVNCLLSKCVFPAARDVVLHL